MKKRSVEFNVIFYSNHYTDQFFFFSTVLPIPLTRRNYLFLLSCFWYFLCFSTLYLIFFSFRSLYTYNCTWENSWYNTFHFISWHTISPVTFFTPLIQKAVDNRNQKTITSHFSLEERTFVSRLSALKKKNLRF